jgi:adenylosuccinate synthase
VEYKKLKELGHLPPTVAIDPRCLITTPFDMMVNQVLEDSRGNARHGSVGIGFGETIGRNIFPAFQLWRSDLASNRTNLAQKLRLIRDNWLPIRLKQLDLPRIPRDDERLSDKVIDFFLEELIAFHDATMIAGAEFLTGKSVIFEGAQGLLLDMDKGKKPHVTRSNTGLKNVVPIAKAARLNLSVVYVTRSYMTRHGAGPLDGEYSPDPPIIDETNSEHPYQGKLRFGRLDTTALLKRVHEDANEAQKVLGVNIPRSIAVSCIDQIDDKTTERNIQTNLKPRFVSFGKTRDHIIRIEGGL